MRNPTKFRSFSLISHLQSSLIQSCLSHSHVPISPFPGHSIHEKKLTFISYENHAEMLCLPMLNFPGQIRGSTPGLHYSIINFYNWTVEIIQAWLELYKGTVTHRLKGGSRIGSIRTDKLESWPIFPVLKGHHHNRSEKLFYAACRILLRLWLHAQSDFWQFFRFRRLT